jgi:GT2 family glycosyltransferase
LDADSSIAVVYGATLLIDALRRPIGRRRAARFSGRALSRSCIISQPASLIRREVWERVGGLDEGLQLSHDYDLWCRINQAGLRFGRIETDVAAARLHSEAKSMKQAAEMYAEATSVVRRHFHSLPLIWRMRQPFSVRGRKQGSNFEHIARAWRRWRT